MSNCKPPRKTQQTTSDGLRDLLLRHGIAPTMNRDADLKLARKIMPKGKQ